MTSKTSTLWLDDDQMQKMIRLIQDAKSKYINTVEMENDQLESLVASAGDAYYTAGTS